MINCDALKSGSLYKIEGERGIWYYSHQGSKNRENKYYFWRDAVKNTRKVTINLSQSACKRKVSEIVW